MPITRLWRFRLGPGNLRLGHFRDGWFQVSRLRTASAAGGDGGKPDRSERHTAHHQPGRATGRAGHSGLGGGRHLSLHRGWRVHRVRRRRFGRSRRFAGRQRLFLVECIQSPPCGLPLTVELLRGDLPQLLDSRHDAWPLPS